MEPQRHILLVDDEKEFLFSAAVALKIAGYRVSVAESGAGVVERIERCMASGPPVDLVVTDIRMAGKSGADVARELRARWPDLPVFIVTGHFERDLELELASCGGIDHLLKPFDPSEFLERVDRVLGRRPAPATEE